MKLLIPMAGLLIGIGAGVGAGLMVATPQEETTVADQKEADPGAIASGLELVSLDNQFIVPVVEESVVTSMVVLTLGLEVTEDVANSVYRREAKLRDVFLRALFAHANIGGFSGDFTSLRNLDMLRSSLLGAAREEIGPDVQGVLIMSLARQDV